MHPCVRACGHTYVRTYARTYMHTYTYMCTCMHARTDGGMDGYTTIIPRPRRPGRGVASSASPSHAGGTEARQNIRLETPFFVFVAYFCIPRIFRRHHESSARWSSSDFTDRLGERQMLRTGCAHGLRGGLRTFFATGLYIRTPKPLVEWVSMSLRRPRFLRGGSQCLASC